jgi:hypothetical protein
LGEHQLDKLGVTGSSPVPPITKKARKRGSFVSVHPGEGTSVPAANVFVWSGLRLWRFLMVIVRRLLGCCFGSGSWWRRTSGLRLGLLSSSGG